MSAGALIGIVIAVVVLIMAALVVFMEVRRARLRRQFGSEYARLAAELGSNRKAEAELIARQRRAAKLNIRPLSAQERTKYTRDWTTVQEQFVDAPAAAAQRAGRLVSTVMRDRGYPVDSQNELIAALSVHHSRKLDDYRQGRDIAARSASATTEQLREAVLHYRELFDDLTGARRDDSGQVVQASRPAQLIRRTQAAPQATAGAGSQRER